MRQDQAHRCQNYFPVVPSPQTPIIIGVTRTAMSTCAVTCTGVVTGTGTVGSISTGARSTKTQNDSKFMILRQTKARMAANSSAKARTILGLPMNLSASTCCRRSQSRKWASVLDQVQEALHEQRPQALLQITEAYCQDVSRIICSVQVYKVLSDSVFDEILKEVREK